MSLQRGGKKRFRSDEEKREICVQARVSGVSIAQVARRYAMNANLIHKWLKEPRFSAVDVELDGSMFLPIEIEGTVSSPPASVASIPSRVPPVSLTAERVDITLSDGRRILVEGATGLSAVVTLIEGLMA